MRNILCCNMIYNLFGERESTAFFTFKQHTLIFCRHIVSNVTFNLAYIYISYVLIGYWVAVGGAHKKRSTRGLIDLLRALKTHRILSYDDERLFTWSVLGGLELPVLQRAIASTVRPRGRDLSIRLLCVSSLSSSKVSCTLFTKPGARYLMIIYKVIPY